jgi:hypothetical protein
VSETVWGAVLGVVAALGFALVILRVMRLGVCVRRGSVYVRGFLRDRRIEATEFRRFNTETVRGSDRLVVDTTGGGIRVPGIQFSSKKDRAVVPLIIHRLTELLAESDAASS